jgi:hypothetical protein
MTLDGRLVRSFGATASSVSARQAKAAVRSRAEAVAGDRACDGFRLVGLIRPDAPPCPARPQTGSRIEVAISGMGRSSGSGGRG